MKLSPDLHVVVVGGTSGLGAMTTAHLYKKGCKATPLSRTSAIPCDITNSDSVARAMSLVADARVLIITSGVPGAYSTINPDTTPAPLERFDDIIRTNLIGSYDVARHFASNCAKLEPTETGERGIIIFTTSIAWDQGKVGQVAYSASKAGVAGMVLPMARELSKYGIRVCAISPGVFDTPMIYTLTPKARARLSEDIPFPNRMGDPEEFASLVAHVIENQYINGTILRLDGGLQLSFK